MQNPEPYRETLQPSTRELLDRYVIPTYGRFPVGLERGSGSYVWDDQGNQYLDFGTGIAVSSLGHAHPAITGAVHAQVESLIHCSNLYYIREQARLAENLVEKVVGIPGKIFFCNSGAEANEALIKLARRFGGQVPHAGGDDRYEVITFEGSFHGRTMAGISATGQSKVKEGFEPLLPGFVHARYNDLESVRAAITKQTAAVLIEPVQGEGGIHPAHPEFLQGLAQLCREHHLLLLMDEVQCGLGRIGDLCAWRAITSDPEVQPDGIAWAKGLGGGVPIGAIWVRDGAISEDQKETRLCHLLGPGSHGSTFGGQPLASAVSLAVLEEIQRHELWNHAVEIGNYLVESIEGWGHPMISQVRGRGLMLGIVLDESKFAAFPESMTEGRTTAAFVVNELMMRGLITIPAGRTVVRLLPPLNVSKSEAAEALDTLQATLALLEQTSANL